MICNYSCKLYHVTLCFFYVCQIIIYSLTISSHIFCIIVIWLLDAVLASIVFTFHRNVYFFLHYIVFYLYISYTFPYNYFLICSFAPSTIVYYSNVHILLRTDSLHCVILSFAMCVLIVCKLRSMYKYYFKFHYTSIITLLSMGVHFVNLEFNHGVHQSH